MESSMVHIDRSFAEETDLMIRKLCRAEQTE
jgi:hypothetical protein